MRELYQPRGAGTSAAHECLLDHWPPPSAIAIVENFDSQEGAWPPRENSWPLRGRQPRRIPQPAPGCHLRHREGTARPAGRCPGSGITFPLPSSAQRWMPFAAAFTASNPPTPSAPVAVPLRACLKTGSGAVFVAKAGSRGATKENTPRGSSTEEQRSETALAAKTLRAACLLALDFVVADVTARCGEVPSAPPRPKPKSPAAAPFPVCKQALRSSPHTYDRASALFVAFDSAMLGQRR